MTDTAKTPDPKTDQKTDKPAKVGPVVKETVMHDGKTYEPGHRLPADTPAGVLARHAELGNI